MSLRCQGVFVGLLLAAAPGVDSHAAVVPRVRPAGPAAQLESLRREERGPRPPPADAAAARREAIALEFLRDHEIGRAIEVLSEAAGLRPQSGRILARLTLAYLENGDFEFARAEVDAASDRADLEPAPAALWSEAAARFAAVNRLEDAIAAWELLERGGNGEGVPSVSARIERARRELAVTPGQRLRQGERFAIYSDSAIPEGVLAAVEAHLEREYDRQREFFGAGDLPGSQTVVLYSGRRFFSLVSVPDWVSGVFDGKIRISIEASSGFDQELASVLSHELAHAWIRFLSGDRAPGWLHEGLAQWCEGRRIPRKDFHAVFTRLPVFSLAEMEGNLGRRGDRAVARANYAEALGIVEYLVFTHGEGALICLLHALSGGAALEDALRREAFVTAVEVVARWKAWAGV